MSAKQPSTHKQTASNSSHEDGKHSHNDFSELRTLSRKRLVSVAVLSGTFMIAELIFGLWTHSLAILADAGHMLGDVAAILLALIANFFATKSATSEKTYGYYRAEILASTFNALCMLGMSAFILHEAYQRFFQTAEVPGMPMIVIGAIGVIVNLVCCRSVPHSFVSVIFFACVANALIFIGNQRLNCRTWP